MKKFPNAFVIILVAIVFAWLLTFLIPKGAYKRVINGDTARSQVVPDSYEMIEIPHLSLFDMLTAIPRGISGRADVIVLILLLGGCFYLIEKTGALNQGLNQLISLLQGKESFALIILILLFLLGGVTIGLQEEVIAMTPILLMFGRNLGYSSTSIVYASYGSTVIGSAFSPLNPFGVVIAQKIAEVDLLSGFGYRVVVLLVVTIAWTTYLLRYARKHRVDKADQILEVEKLSGRNKLILALLVITFILVTFGLLRWDWGFTEMSACFFVLGIICGLIAKFGLNKTTEIYVEGFKEMVFAAIIIGLANSISIILSEGSVIDTIVYGLFGPMDNLSASVSAVLMMVAHTVLHFPIPSYSGQAILTMPILTPLADLIGLSRQVCVLAYQYGAIMMDVIVPTNGALMAVIALAGIKYNDWLRFIIKPTLLVLTLAAIAILVAVEIGYS